MSNRHLPEADCTILKADFGTPGAPKSHARDVAFFKGHYASVKCFDKDGKLKWEDEAHNLITNAGLNDVLNEYIRGTSQTTAWYMGLVDNASWTAFAAGDTAASHTGWLESAAYSNATRPQWSPGASSGQSITNGSTVNFTINATATIKGLFIISNNTISGTTGTLFSEAAFSGGNQAVQSGDTLQCTYTLSLASN